MTVQNKYIRYPFFFTMLIGVSLLIVMIFLPYMMTLAVATTFAVIIQPLYKQIQKLFGGRSALASAVTILVTALLVLVPLSLIVLQVVQEATTLYEHIGSSPDIVFGDLIDQIERNIQSYIPTFELNIEGSIRQSLGWISSHLGALFAGTFSTAVNFFLGIIALYYLLKDGKSFINSFVKLSPLTDKHDHAILDRLSRAVNSIVKGSLFIALVQGIISGIGFAIFGVPSPTLWGSLAAIGALVPGVGTAIVIAPAVLYLFFTAELWQAIGMAIWGAVAVGTIDNVVGPMLVGKNVRIHPLLILFSVIGGIQFFGPLGFILGPLTLSLLFALLDIYSLFLEHSLTKAAK